VTELVLDLPARPPFDGGALLGFLAARAIPGLEDASAGEHRRAVPLPHGTAVMGVAPRADGVRVRLWGADARDADAAAALAAALLDLDADPAAVRTALGDDPVIGPLVRARPGLRVPGSVDPAELAVRAVIGQQVSVAGAATVAGRLVAEHGEPLEVPVGAVTHAFPAPDALADADPESLPMPRARGRAIVTLATAIAAGDVDLRPGADPGAAEAALLALGGIGPWTAAYVRLRGLGDRDAFPAADLGLRRALESLGRDGSPRAALALAEGWRPLRAYAAQHLWTVQAGAPASAAPALA
jgi:AraC family transcriptional regulator of adaptative response / DNA-3-methyladenine glycosylase II